MPIHERVLDASRGLRALAQASPRAGLRKLALVGFGDRARVLKAGLDEQLLSKSLEDILSSSTADISSDLLSAVPFVFELVPSGVDVHLVVFTDFRLEKATLGQVQRQVASRGSSLRFVPAPARTEADVGIALTTSAEVERSGSIALVDFHVFGHALQARRQVRVRCQEASLTVALDPGSAVRGRLEVSVKPSQTELRLEVADPGGSDSDPRNNAATVALLGVPSRRILVLGSDAEPAATELRATGSTVDVARDFDDVDPKLLSSADVIVLANGPELSAATRIHEGVLLRAVSERGLGLVVLGGNRAFAAGGFAGSRLDEELPLRSTPPKGLDVRILLDRSGSMEASDRLGRAKSAIVRLAERLTPSDRIQVIPFSTEPDRPVLAKPEVPETFLNLGKTELWQLRPHGGTRVKLALDQLEWRADAGATGPERIVILLSDFKDSSVQGPDAIQDIREQWRREDVRAFIVLLDADEESLERAGRTGATVRQAQAVTPEILIETLPREGSIEGRIAAEWVGKEAPLAEVGEVSSHNPVSLRSDAILMLQGPRLEPLMAKRQHGAGVIVALATRLPQGRSLLSALLSAVAQRSRPGFRILPGFPSRVVADSTLQVREDIRLLTPEGEIPLQETGPWEWTVQGGTVPDSLPSADLATKDGALVARLRQSAEDFETTRAVLSRPRDLETSTRETPVGRRHVSLAVVFLALLLCFEFGRWRVGPSFRAEQ